MKIHLRSFACYRDTSETDSDEPYVLVFAADMTNGSAKTILYPRWGQVDSGDRGKAGYMFIGPGGSPVIPPENFWDGPMSDPEQVIFLTALMENDNGHPDGIRAALHGMLYADFASAVRARPARQQLVDRLKRTMRDALKGPIAIGILNKDDLIDVQEVDVRRAVNRPGTLVVSTQMRGDGGHYALYFNVVN